MDPITAILILAVVTVGLALLNQPKISRPDPGDIGSSVPKVSENKKIPIIFGRVWISDPSIVWYGDIKTRPIKKCGGKK